MTSLKLLLDFDEDVISDIRISKRTQTAYIVLQTQLTTQIQLALGCATQVQLAKGCLTQ